MTHGTITTLKDTHSTVVASGVVFLLNTPPPKAHT